MVGLVGSFSSLVVAGFGFNGKLFNGSWDQRHQLGYRQYVSIFAVVSMIAGLSCGPRSVFHPGSIGRMLPVAAPSSLVVHLQGRGRGRTFSANSRRSKGKGGFATASQETLPSSRPCDLVLKIRKVSERPGHLRALVALSVKSHTGSRISFPSSVQADLTQWAQGRQNIESSSPGLGCSLQVYKSHLALDPWGLRA